VKTCTKVGTPAVPCVTCLKALVRRARRQGVLMSTGLAEHADLRRSEMFEVLWVRRIRGGSPTTGAGAGA
jgi:hypothetical protein